MLTKSKENQDGLILATLDELTPSDHLVRKLNKIDYRFIYKEVSDYYADDGRPSIDPVVLFKILLIKNVFKIQSLRQTLKEIEVNVAYRYFLNLPFSDNLPHYSVLSNTFNRRLDKTIYHKIMNRIKYELATNGFIEDNTYTLRKKNIKNEKKKDIENLYPERLV